MTRSTSRGCPSVGEAPTQRGRTRAAACAGSPVCTRGSVRAGGGLALAENILVIILSPSQTWEPPLLNQKRCQQAPSGAAAWLRGVGSQSSFVQKSAHGLERKKNEVFFSEVWILLAWTDTRQWLVQGTRLQEPGGKH